ncbi:MAG TPA: outer membrane beta-barrel protein [Allosphingosinicella sp.]|jgi:outer membrane immunogenic protein
MTIHYLKPTLAAAAGLLLTALPAAPAAAQSSDAESWTGPYFGGRLGYAFQRSDQDETVLFDTDLDGSFDNNVTTGTGANAFSPGFCGGAATTRTPPAGGCADDRDGTDWAAHAGFDYQMGPVVVGLVGEYGRTDISDSVAAFSTTPAFYTLTRELRDTASLRARVGFASGNTLVYGTGGVAWGKIRNSFFTSNTANVFTNSGNDDAWGYRAGGGIEQRLGRGFSIGAQYLYTSLKDDDFRVRAGGPAPAGNPFLRTNAAGTDFARSGDRFNSHSAHVTASFRF